MKSLRHLIYLNSPIMTAQKNPFIILKELEYHRNPPLSSYCHTSRNGMTHKAHMKAKKVQKKKKDTPRFLWYS